MHLGSHHTHYHFSRMGELGKMYWAHAISNIGWGLFSVFIPIYLYTLGHQISDILLFYALTGLFGLCLLYPGLKLTGLIGANRTLAVGLLVNIVMILLLVTLPTYHWPLWLIALAWSADRGFYWPPFHANFSKARVKGKGGAQVGVLFALIALGSGLAPAIGGIIASAFGIALVYGIAVGAVAISVLPLLKGEDVITHRKASFRALNFRRIWPDMFANFSHSFMSLSELVIWPLLVFFLIPSYAGVGLLSSVMVISSILISLYVGRRQQRGSRHYLKEGDAVMLVANSLRVAAGNAGQVAGVNLIAGMGHSLVSTPYLSKYYDHADEEPRLAYVAAMETMYALGQTVYFGLLFGLALLLPGQTVLVIGLLLGIPGTLGIIKMR